MSALAALQRRFAADVRGQHGAVSALVTDGPNCGREALLEVYRHAYGARLVESLGVDFAVTRRAMGDLGFDLAAADYIVAHPSRTPSIRWLGRQFAPFLSARDGAAGALAALEWTIGLAFDGADGPTVEPAALGLLDEAGWMALRLGFHPTVHRLGLSHAADDEIGRDAPALPAALAAARALVVWRHGLDVQFRALEADEAALLDGARAGTAFGDLLDRLDLAPEHAVLLLAQWCAAGMVSTLR